MRKRALRVVEAEPASSTPPVGVDVRMFTAEKHGFGALAPSPTRGSLLN